MKQHIIQNIVAAILVLALLGVPAKALAAPNLSVSGGQWAAVGGGGFTNNVFVVTTAGTNVYVGGSFANLGGNPAADYIAMWDGTSWTNLGSGLSGNGALNGAVQAIYVEGSDVYVGGGFTTVYNGDTQVIGGGYIAKWDGASWSSLGVGRNNGPSITGIVLSIVRYSGDLYAGGVFTYPYNGSNEVTNGDYIARWDGANWSGVGTDGAGRGPLKNGVYSMVVMDNLLYVGGSFINVTQNSTLIDNADFLAKWNGSTWSGVSTGANGQGSLSSVVYTLAVNGADLYAGGNFLNANNNGTAVPEADYIAKWSGTAWSALGSDGAGNGALNHPVWSIAFANGNVYAGGSFTGVNNNGKPLNEACYVARWNGTDWASLGSNGSGGSSLPDTVWSLGVLGSTLYVGGTFLSVNNNGMTLSNSGRLAAYGLFADATAPQVQSITRADANPTTAASVDFTVTFSEAVTGVDPSDFALTTSGLTGASVTGVSGSGMTYTVTASTGTGKGTLRLDLADDDSIVDLATNHLGTQGAGNGSFSAGEAYNIGYWIYLPVVTNPGK